MKKPYTHPQRNPAIILFLYRRHILYTKKRYGIARGLVHYKGFIEEYLAAKRAVRENFNEADYLVAKKLVYPNKNFPARKSVI